MKRAAKAASFGLVASVAILSGCTNLSGLAAGSDYACKAPEGVTCQSVSGTYANAVADNLPSQRARATAPTAPAPVASTPVIPIRTAGAPLRSAPRILRLWFKSWEDADGDLFDQGHVYVKVDGGRWLVEHAQRAVREAHAPVRAASVRGASEPPPPTADAARGSANLPSLPPLQVRPMPATPPGSGQPRD